MSKNIELIFIAILIWGLFPVIMATIMSKKDDQTWYNWWEIYKMWVTLLGLFGLVMFLFLFAPAVVKLYPAQCSVVAIWLFLLALAGL